MNNLLVVCRRCVADPRYWIVASALLVWCVAFPEDLQALLNPAKQLLSLSKEISTGLYAIAAGGLAGWGVYRTFGRTAR